MKEENSRMLAILHILNLFNSFVAKDYDYNYHEITALRYIKSTGGVSQSSLVKKLLLDKSSVTKIVNSFVKKGLVKRDFDPADLRYRILVPTDILMEIELPETDFTNIFFDFATSGCTKKEKEIFYKVVEKVHARVTEEEENNFSVLEQLVPNHTPSGEYKK